MGLDKAEEKLIAAQRSVERFFLNTTKKTDKEIRDQESFP